MENSNLMTTKEFPSLTSIGAECDFVSDSTATVRVLWGVAPTGSIHLGYAAYLFLLRRLRAAGAEVILLVANYHGYLDSNKAKWEAIDRRTLYYKQVFTRAGFPTPLETKDFYRSADYIESLFRFSGLCRVRDALLAGQGTLRATPETASVSDLLYVATQVLDVHFLRVNLVTCGMDESSIYRYGLPLLQEHFGWRCSHIYLPPCPGIIAAEMHASDGAQNKILLSDTPDAVREKIEIHCARSRTASPLLEFCVRTLFPLAGRDDLSERLNSLAVNNSANIVSDLSHAVSSVLQELKVEKA